MFSDEHPPLKLQAGCDHFKEGPTLPSLPYLFSVTIVLCIPNHTIETQEGGESLEEKNKYISYTTLHQKNPISQDFRVSIVTHVK